MRLQYENNLTLAEVLNDRASYELEGCLYKLIQPCRTCNKLFLQLVVFVVAVAAAAVVAGVVSQLSALRHGHNS